MQTPFLTDVLGLSRCIATRMRQDLVSDRQLQLLPQVPIWSTNPRTVAGLRSIARNRAVANHVTAVAECADRSQLEH